MMNLPERKLPKFHVVDVKRTPRNFDYQKQEFIEEPKVMFTIVSGQEKYKVIDLNTNGESFFDDKIQAYKMMHVIKNILGHNYRLEVR